MKFNLKLKLTAVISAVSLFFAGCDTVAVNGAEKQADLSAAGETGFEIQLPGAKKQERAAFWSQDDATYYEVGLYDGNSYMSKTGYPGSTVKFIVTKGGTYTITVYAYKDDLLIAEGSASCSINLGDGIVNVSVMLDPKQKREVQLNVQIGWNEPDIHEPVPVFQEPVTNCIGTVSGNLVADGDADGGTSEEEKPCTLQRESGVYVQTIEGGASGNCWKVIQGGYNEWQEVYFNLTDFYGRGKSYLVSFKAKANEENGVTSSGVPLTLGYAVVSFAEQKSANSHGYEWYDWLCWDESNPDIKGPWDGSFMDADLSCELGRGSDTYVHTEPLTEDWVQYSYVIPATEIDRIVNGTGLYHFAFAISMGERGGGQYSYLIDDFSIKDLNAELPRTGAIPLDAVRYWNENSLETVWKIYDAYDLIMLSSIVNSGYSLAGVTILLENDITLNKNLLSPRFREPLEAEPCVAAEGLVNLDSIGRGGAGASSEDSNPFSGTFDGQGHIISGFYSYQAHRGLGLFGRADGAVIRNLILLDSCVIANCESDNADDRFGGLIGLVVSNGGVTVENCVVECVVGSEETLIRSETGSYNYGRPEYCGGLIGRCDGYSFVTDCTVLARVFARQNSASIICGKNEDRITQTNVYCYDAATDLEAGRAAVQEAAAAIREQFNLQ